MTISAPRPAPEVIWLPEAAYTQFGVVGFVHTGSGMDQGWAPGPGRRFDAGARVRKDDDRPGQLLAGCAAVGRTYQKATEGKNDDDRSRDQACEDGLARADHQLTLPTESGSCVRGVSEFS